MILDTNLHKLDADFHWLGGFYFIRYIRAEHVSSSLWCILHI